MKQQLSQATEQRETLQVQLDSINTHVSLLEAELHKEKTKCREAQVERNNVYVGVCSINLLLILFHIAVKVGKSRRRLSTKKGRFRNGCNPQ